MMSIVQIIIVGILLCLAWGMRALAMHLIGWNGSGGIGFCMVFLAITGIILVCIEITNSDDQHN